MYCANCSIYLPKEANSISMFWKIEKSGYCATTYQLFYFIEDLPNK